MNYYDNRDQELQPLSKKTFNVIFRAFIDEAKKHEPDLHITKEKICKRLEGNGLIVHHLGEVGIQELENITGFNIDFVGDTEIDYYGYKLKRKIIKRVDQKKPKNESSPIMELAKMLEKLELEIPCDDLVFYDDYCEKHCSDITLKHDCFCATSECWIRWAKLKSGHKI